MTKPVGAVVIGRNEGERLKGCLTSLRGSVKTLVYVDSGSTDASLDVARSAGAQVVELDLSTPFTAARARNAGLKRLIDVSPDVEYIQFLDGDCEMADGWMDIAEAALDADAGLAVVCGRRRERFPDASIWNRLADAEWDTPVGDTTECGGDALMRRAALEAVDGYRETMIAGEEPEMCFRMRAKGWRIERLAAEMTKHDAAMTKYTQWWQRCRRAGYAYALGAALHWPSAERYRVKEVRRALLWGAVLPVVILVGVLLLSPWVLLAVLSWPLQVMRLRLKAFPWEQALFLTVSKFPEAQGALEFGLDRVMRRRRSLIEYK